MEAAVLAAGLAAVTWAAAGIQEDAVSHTHQRHLHIVSTTRSGGQGNNLGSFDPSLANNGRYASFDSFSSNLVPGDTNGAADVFLKNLRTGALTLVSSTDQGKPANGSSQNWGVSENGRYVAFGSEATNLVAGDTNGQRDIFVKDLRTGHVTLVSADAQGHIAQGGESFVASISADGRTVAFGSMATNLVSGDTNGANDIFVKDLRTGHIVLASSDAAGNEGTGPSSAYNGASAGPSLSANGRHVAFYSFAENLVRNDTNHTADVFVKDLRTGAIVLASTDSAGHQANDVSNGVSLSADGRLVAFQSFASNLAPGDGNQTSDVFVKDLCTGKLTLVSADAEGHVGNGQSLDVSISPNGRYVAFASSADNLVSGDTNGTFDVFVKDLCTGKLTLVSAGPHGEPADFQSVEPHVNDNGDVIFASGARNLVEHDSNSNPDFYPYDIFLWA